MTTARRAGHSATAAWRRTAMDAVGVRPYFAHSMRVINDALIRTDQHAVRARFLRVLRAACPDLAAEFPAAVKKRGSPAAVPAAAAAEIEFLIALLEAAVAYTTQLVADGPSPGAGEPLYCTCRMPASGNMVACDRKDCEFEWYHLECLKETNLPQGKWFCPACRRKMRLSSTRR